MTCRNSHNQPNTEPRFKPRSVWLQTLNYPPLHCIQETCESPAYERPMSTSIANWDGKERKAQFKKFLTCVYVHTYRCNTCITYVEYSRVLLNKSSNFSFHSQCSRSYKCEYSAGHKEAKYFFQDHIFPWLLESMWFEAKSMALSTIAYTTYATIMRHTQSQLAFIKHPQWVKHCASLFHKQ